MAAAKCIVGDVVDDYVVYNIDDCLLIPPKENDVEDVFQSILKQSTDSQLVSSEGCYFHYDRLKKKWIRSGKASGDSKNACFEGRLDTHTKNARMLDQMRKHRL